MVLLKYKIRRDEEVKKLLLLVLIIVAFAGIKEVWDEGKTLSSDSFSASGERIQGRIIGHILVLNVEEKVYVRRAME